MLLKELKLVNIKTYVEEKITFSEGINAIIGLNGSGKSTIIESVGYALFNYSKGKKIQDILRHETKKGSISLTFVANDGLTYRVERIIKKVGQVQAAIYSENNPDEILYAGTNEVNSYIKKILKIKNEQELAKLFSEVIAVPQGAYVSAFLENKNVRVQTFNRLLGLDEYKDISDKMRSLKNYINDVSIRPLEVSIGELKGETNDYESNKKNYLAKLKEISELEETLKVAQKEYASIQKKVEESSKKAKRISELENEIDKDQLNIENAERLLKTDKENLSKADVAFKIVEESEAKYNNYQSNAKKIEELEADIKDASLIEEEKSDAKSKLAALKATILALEAQDEEKSKAQSKNEKEASDAEEGIIKDDEKYQKEKASYNLEVSANEKELKESEEKETKNSQDLNALRINLEKAKSLRSNNKESKALLSKEKELKEKNEQIIQAKVEKERLISKRANLFAIINRKEELKNLAIDGLCPIFNTKCSNTSDTNNKSIDCVLDEQIKGIDEEIRALDQKTNELDKVIQEENEVISNRISLENLKQDIDEDSIKLAEIIKSLGEMSLDVDKQDIANSLSRLIKKYEDEQASLVEITTRTKTKKNELINLNSKLMSENLRLENRKIRLKELQETIKTAKSNQEDIKLLIKENISEQKKLLEMMQELEKRVQEIGLVKEKITNLKVENKALEKDNESYIANLKESTKKAGYLEAIDKTNQVIKELTNCKNGKVEELQLLKNHYDEVEATKLNERQKILNNEVVSKENLIVEKQKNNSELEGQIKQQEEKIASKTKKEEELKKNQEMCNFIDRMRDVYQSLPKELSDKYRQGISKIASELYRLIAKDNVHIEIDDEYVVKLIDNIDSKKVTEIVALSGGEQMSVAIATRLAMLKYLTNLDIYFLDEPTVNLDYERRAQVGEVVDEISSSLSQIYVISHDDTFDAISQNLIHVVKTDGVSNLEE